MPGNDAAMITRLRSWREAIDDPAAPACVRFFLKAASKPSLPGGLPTLFATVKLDLPGRTMSGAMVVRQGQRVRVVDAGKFGDVGITTNLEDADSAQARASLGELERFAEAA